MKWKCPILGCRFFAGTRSTINENCRWVDVAQECLCHRKHWFQLTDITPNSSIFGQWVRHTSMSYFKSLNFNRTILNHSFAFYHCKFRKWAFKSIPISICLAYINSLRYDIQFLDHSFYTCRKCLHIIVNRTHNHSLYLKSKMCDNRKIECNRFHCVVNSHTIKRQNDYAAKFCINREKNTVLIILSISKYFSFDLVF